MPPKQIKKQIETTNITTDTPAESIDSIKQEWLKIVKDLAMANDNVIILEKKRDELVAKLWEHMNKNPSEPIIESVKPTKQNVTKEDNSSDTPKTTKSKAKEEVVETPKTTKSKAKEEVETPKTTKAKAVKEPEPKPAAKSKVVTKTSKVVAPVESDDEDIPAVVEKKPVKSTAKTDNKLPVKGKITAPTKGTPKPKITDNSEDEVKPAALQDSSSETDLDSLSSVSSESEGSGGEDD
jgi:hypothetical protein